MQIFSRRWFPFVYGTIVALDILAAFYGPSGLRIVTKPLIVLSLLINLRVQANGDRSRSVQLLKWALMAGLAGDIFLLFDHHGNLYFILGLLSFLIGHIGYIVLFSRRGARPWTPASLGISLLIAFYGLMLFRHIQAGLGQLKFAVILYILIILAMAITAFRRKDVGRSSYRKVLMGALLFMASDSILAVNLFVGAVPLASLWIMATYASAQYLIVQGILDQGPKKVV